MKFKILAFFIVSVACFASCNRTFLWQNSKEAVMETKMSEMPNGTEAIFILKEQKILPKGKQLPQDFYITGTIIDGNFVVNGKIQGTGSLGAAGRKGWLELNTNEFFPEESGRRAISPFVQGYMTDNGFVPSTREVSVSP